MEQEQAVKVEGRGQGQRHEDQQQGHQQEALVVSSSTALQQLEQQQQQQEKSSSEKRPPIATISVASRPQRATTPKSPDTVSPKPHILDNRRTLSTTNFEASRTTRTSSHPHLSQKGYTTSVQSPSSKSPRSSTNLNPPTTATRGTTRSKTRSRSDMIGSGTSVATITTASSSRSLTSTTTTSRQHSTFTTGTPRWNVGRSVSQFNPPSLASWNPSSPLAFALRTANSITTTNNPFSPTHLYGGPHNKKPGTRKRTSRKSFHTDPSNPTPADTSERRTQLDECTQILEAFKRKG
ncbi:hypothetical protein HK102_012851, partial [Quaeritorhiza haematococci]